MLEEIVTCEYERLAAVILPRLKGHVFHVTNDVGYARIQASGAIRMRGTAPVMATLTPISFGRAQGYVCLLDLRTASDQLIAHTLQEFYYFLDPYEDSSENVFLVLVPSAYEELVPNYVGVKARGQAAVPELEVWYPSQLPLTMIERAFRVAINRRDPWDVAIDKGAFLKCFPPDA
jgi:hypothetical protein